MDVPSTKRRRLAVASSPHRRRGRASKRGLSRHIPSLGAPLAKKGRTAGVPTRGVVVITGAQGRERPGGGNVVRAAAVLRLPCVVHTVGERRQASAVVHRFARLHNRWQASARALASIFGCRVPKPEAEVYRTLEVVHEADVVVAVVAQSLSGGHARDTTAWQTHPNLVSSLPTAFGVQAGVLAALRRQEGVPVDGVHLPVFVWSAPERRWFQACARRSGGYLLQYAWETVVPDAELHTTYETLLHRVRRAYDARSATGPFRTAVLTSSRNNPSADVTTAYTALVDMFKVISSVAC